MSQELKKLTDLAKSVQVSGSEQEQQRRSFAYGNTKIENELITRALVDEQAEQLKKRGDD